MNRQDLIDEKAARAELTKTDAGRALESALEAISAALSRGGDVRITGFGTFVLKDRSARTARNPRTGETMGLPATTTPAFKPGKALKDAVA